jgi:outer membrane immunogenic protein
MPRPLAWFFLIVNSTRLGDWYGVIAGRAGWTANQALFYVKGGVAFVNHSYNFNDTCVGGGCGGNMLVLGHSDTQVTYAVGAGVEYAFNNNWSVKGEYPIWVLRSPTTNLV